MRERLGQLEHIVVVDPSPETDAAGAISLDELRERGRRRDKAELDARAAAVKPSDAYTFMYTSGTTGPPKGCVLTHGNYRSVLDMVQSSGGGIGCRGRHDLPVPPPRPRVRAARAARGDRRRRDHRLLGRGPEADHRRAVRGPADLPALGPAHLREALRARHRPRRRGADRRGHEGRPRRSGACGRPANPYRRSCRPASTAPRRPCSRTCARPSAAVCARRSPARRRSRRTSSSSSTRAASR